MKAALPAYSEAIGEIFHCLKVFVSRVMRCQEGDVQGLGTRTGSTLQPRGSVT